MIFPIFFFNFSFHSVWMTFNNICRMKKMCIPDLPFFQFRVSIIILSPSLLVKRSRQAGWIHTFSVCFLFCDNVAWPQHRQQHRHRHVGEDSSRNDRYGTFQWLNGNAIGIIKIAVQYSLDTGVIIYSMPFV